MLLLFIGSTWLQCIVMHPGLGLLRHKLSTCQAKRIEDLVSLNLDKLWAKTPYSIWLVVMVDHNSARSSLSLTDKPQGNVEKQIIIIFTLSFGC